MADNQLHMIDSKTWNRWSFYLNIVIFGIVALATAMMIIHSYLAGTMLSVGGDALTQAMLYVTADAVILAICLTYIFVQLFRYQRIIMRRSW